MKDWWENSLYLAANRYDYKISKELNFIAKSIQRKNSNS